MVTWSPLSRRQIYSCLTWKGYSTNAPLALWSHATTRSHCTFIGQMHYKHILPSQCSSSLTPCLASRSSCATTPLLVNQLQLSLQTHNPSFIVVWSQLPCMLSHRVLAPFLQAPGEFLHSWLKLLIGEAFRSDKSWGLPLSCLRVTSGLGLLLLTSCLHFDWFRIFFKFTCFWRLAPHCRAHTRLLTFSWHVASPTHFTNCISLTACIFSFFGFLLFLLFDILLGRSFGLHDVVNKIVDVLLVDLLVCTFCFFLLTFRRLEVVCIFAASFALAILVRRKVTQYVASCYTSTHAAAVGDTFLVLLVLVTVTVVVAAHSMLLGLLLLIVVSLLVESTGLGLGIGFFLLLFSLKLLSSFELYLLFSVFV